jgi:hypothetical protein
VARPSDDSGAGREVEAAIARVLDAERDARAAVSGYERRAEALRADARAADRRIADRAAARIAAVRGGMADKLAARLAAIEAQSVATDPQAVQDEAARRRLDDAVARLADELTEARP